MRLARIALSDFRNYPQLELEPQPGLNVFVGRNAQGKSNLLEAIAMLGVGKSFRTSRDADTIRNGCEQAVMSGDVLSQDASVRLACAITRTPGGARKAWTRAGRKVSYATFLGTLSVVTFVPSDLQMVTGAPALRRAFLNTALAQYDRDYYRSLARYQGALRQKSALLRGARDADDALLDVYDATLAQSGAVLMSRRAAFVQALGHEAAGVHAAWTGGTERLRVQYLPNVAAGAMSDEELQDAIAQRLRSVRAAERLRRIALAGPHRDDLAFALENRSLATFGSQGQQRTAVLALKVAEYTVMRDRSGAAPLLLLDDLLSELDEDRAAAFLAGVGGYEQAFVTATHLPAPVPPGSAVYAVDDAVLRAASC